MSKYDQVIDWIGSYWVGALALLLMAALAALPGTRDGYAIVLSAFKKLLNRLRRRTFKIGTEKVWLTTMLREDTYDVVKVEADVHIAGVAGEHAWVKRKYRGSEITGQSLTTLDLMQGRGYEASQIHFDVLKLKLRNGKRKDVYFDISSFFHADPLAPLDPKSSVGLKIARLYKKAEQGHAGDARNARA